MVRRWRLIGYFPILYNPLRGAQGTGAEPAEVVLIKLEVTLGGLPPPQRNGGPPPPRLPLPPPEQLTLELGRTIKWASDKDLAFVQRHPSVTLAQAEIIHALAELQHTRLGLHRPCSFTLTNVMAIIESPLSLTFSVAIADLFTRRFDPARCSSSISSPLPPSRSLSLAGALPPSLFLSPILSLSLSLSLPL
jgi:hypothetical protein